jgi:hypothetical protein
MDTFEVAVEVLMCTDDCADEEVSATLDRIMEAMVDSSAIDPFVGGSIASGKFEITLVVEAETEVDAVDKGTRLIREAIEKTGLDFQPTPLPPEPTMLSWSSTSVRPGAVA